MTCEQSMKIITPYPTDDDQAAGRIVSGPYSETLFFNPPQIPHHKTVASLVLRDGLNDLAGLATNLEDHFKAAGSGRIEAGPYFQKTWLFFYCALRHTTTTTTTTNSTANQLNAWGSSTYGAYTSYPLFP